LRNFIIIRPVSSQSIVTSTTRGIHTSTANRGTRLQTTKPVISLCIVCDTVRHVHSFQCAGFQCACQTKTAIMGLQQQQPRASTSSNPYAWKGHRLGPASYFTLGICFGVALASHFTRMPISEGTLHYHHDHVSELAQPYCYAATSSLCLCVAFGVPLRLSVVASLIT
jgi:hypothetical protein